MKHLRAILFLMAAGIVAAACNAGNPPPAESEGDYATQIQSARAALDRDVPGSAGQTGARGKDE